LIDAGGGASVGTVAKIEEQLRHWLTDDAARSSAGTAARNLVEKGLGAADRSWRLVERLLDGSRGALGGG
jgi:3-deoxy-D-manno-octulosonic-acid transferase